MPNPSTVASQDEPNEYEKLADAAGAEPGPKPEPTIVAIFHTGKIGPIRATSWTHEDGGWYAESPISPTTSSMKWIPDSAILYVEFVEELPA